MILDERSMISKEILGLVDKYLSECFTPDKKDDYIFGALPVVIIFGDDHQLPSVVVNGRGKGALHILDEESNTSGTELNGIEHRGAQCFLKLSEKVIELKKNHRSNCNDLLHMLSNLRNDGLDNNQVNRLQKLHISRVDNETKQYIDKHATYIFATREKTMNHNYTELHRLHSKENPIALMKSRYTNATRKPNKQHFDQHSFPNQTILCVGAKVAITGKNFQPTWGLFNGSVGTVVYIHFETGNSPNQNDLPLYIIVDFPVYCGPSWNKNEPTVSNFCFLYLHYAYFHYTSQM